ncbi:MAG: glycine--tRNA ligase subunit beta, partial [Sphingomonadaceae bacterium]|nr:glycine--tRNA ligase subunit beta [Sphingomonadaceae bacterium]
QITFHEKLGSVANKVERVEKLARWLVDEGIVKGATADAAERAARLCKADLVTGMVGEFPELQGIMGGYYARAQGESDAVADAIRDHYKPVGQGDDVPNAAVTVAVSLADKLDTLAQFFAAGMPPTGSKDPFALRRAAIGFLSLLLQNDLRCSLKDMLVASEAGGSFDTLEEFLIDRLKVQQREAGVRHDLIDAVFSLGGEDDLVRLLARVKALQAYITTAEGANLLAAYKRAANIFKQADGAEKTSVAPAQAGAHHVSQSETTDEIGSSLRWSDADLGSEESALRNALDAAEPKATAALSVEDFEGAMAALATLRAPIDAFFEAVMVNDPDPAKRAFRLGLLARFRVAVTQVADFSKIEG